MVAKSSLIIKIGKNRFRKFDVMIKKKNSSSLETMKKGPSYDFNINLPFKNMWALFERKIIVTVCGTSSR